jgi:hypothetical protein
MFVLSSHAFKYSIAAEIGRSFPFCCCHGIVDFRSVVSLDQSAFHLVLLGD